MTVTAAVCTTGARLDGLRRALASVGEADEVLVVADGARLGELGEGVRVVDARGHGPGAARSTALAEARGEVLAFCDDDDEWLPGHLDALTAPLRAGADVAYGDAELVVDGAPHGVVAAPEFNFDDLYRRGNFIVPSEAAVSVAAAREAGGFDPALGAHEDWDLWLRMPGRARRVPAVVARRAWSADGVAAGDHWDVWERVVEAHRARLAAAGEHARHDIDVAAAPLRDFDRATWSDGRRELVVYGSLTEGYSYGDHCRRLVPALARCGVDVVVAPGRTQPPPGYERHFRPLEHWGRLGLYLHVLSRPEALPCARTVAYSMWESTGIPDWRVEAINRGAAALLVPCEQNRTAFAERGVRVPVRVAHAGIDPAAFPLLERPHRDVFTFGTFGDLTPRKGVDVLLRAFLDEFGPREPVRLVLKSGAPLALDTDDPRIEVVSGFYGADALLELLRGFDAFVMPSRGEGFGLCALEAMATGLPTIATAWGGPAEYLDAADSYPLDYRLADAGGTRVRDNEYRGLWADPDEGHLRALMREVFEDPAAAAARGRLAAARVRRDWTWDRAARDLRDELDAVAAA